MLSQAALSEIDRAIAKYPEGRQQSAVMAALTVAQAEKGYLSPEVMAFVADYLKMPAVWVEEVATFYNMYDTKPVGRYKITVCTNLPCALSGGDTAAELLKRKLGVGFHETTKDGLFTLMEGECMGACGDAPVMLLNNHHMCSFMSEEKIDALIADLKAKAGATT